MVSGDQHKGKSSLHSERKSTNMGYEVLAPGTLNIIVLWPHCDVGEGSEATLHGLAHFVDDAVPAELRIGAASRSVCGRPVRNTWSCEGFGAQGGFDGLDVRERTNREARRGAKVVQAFPSAHSLERPVGAAMCSMSGNPFWYCRSAVDGTGGQHGWYCL